MKKIILSIAIILPSVLFGQLDRSIRPEAAEAPAINIEDSEVFTTSNGITVILSENHKLPRVSFNLVMGASPKVEGNMAGLSEVAGSLIMSGTTNRTKDQLDSEKDYIGASLSADNNSIYLSCLTKHMDKGLTLMSDVMMNANFPQSEVDRIISMNESNLLSAKSDPGTMAGNAKAIANFPKNHPFGEVMTEETLANINRDAVVNYFKETFTPNGSYLVIVGDINKEQAEKVVESYFAKWTGGDVYKAKTVEPNKNSGNRVLFVKKTGAVQSNISITYPIDINPAHEDYLKLKVLNGILGGGAFGNRLMQNLREDKAYTYGCRSGVSVNMDGSYFTAGGNFRNEVTDSAITQILFELERITDDYVKDDELNLTKSSMAGGFARSLESPSTIARFALGIIKYDLPKDYYQTYLKKLAAINKEDILMVAQKYLTADKCNIVVVGNEEVIDRLTQFDADGKIEKLDAFGRPVLDRVAADITADEFFEKYATAMTQGLTGKKRAKVLKKIKSYEAVIEMSMAQMPAPMNMTNVWMANGSTGSKMEMQGMTIQKSYFDGSAGASTSMQTGTEEMTGEEISAKKKSIGLIPEMNYATSGMEYELLGIEEREGKMCYVLKLNDGEQESYEYFDKETMMRVATTTIITQGEESQEMTYTFGNYKAYNGVLFPDEMNMSIGGMTFKGTVKSRTINAKIDLNDFK
jgi:predicted Zn-dependent peptidase